MKVSTSSTEDLEAFLQIAGMYIREVADSVTIDLYTDFKITEPRAEKIFEKLRREAEKSNRPRTGFWSRFHRKSDLLMGVPVDLSTSEGLEAFSVLAPIVIGCEAYKDGKLIFSIIENENTVWLDIASQEAARLVAQAHQAGAASVALMED